MKFTKTFLASVLAAVSFAFSMAAQESLPGVYSDYQLLFEADSLIPKDITLRGATQGMAIHGKYAFSFHNGGDVVIFDIRKKKYVNSFKLENNKSHCNSANFGKEKYSSKSEFPLLYISECMGPRGNACNVTDITLEGSKIVQRILYKDKDAAMFFDWCVDPKGGYIYTYGGRHGKPKTLRKFRLPSLSDSDENGEVILTSADVIQEYTIPSVIVAQGNFFKGRYAYFTDGPAPKCYIHKVDLETGTTKTYDISEYTFEPEDIIIKGKWAYIHNFTGISARRTTIYRLKLK